MREHVRHANENKSILSENGASFERWYFASLPLFPDFRERHRTRLVSSSGINIMYSLGLLIVDLETARRRLLDVFEEPDKGSGRTVAEPLPRSAHRQPKDVDGDRQTFHLPYFAHLHITATNIHLKCSAWAECRHSCATSSDFNARSKNRLQENNPLTLDRRLSLQFHSAARLMMSLGCRGEPLRF